MFMKNLRIWVIFCELWQWRVSVSKSGHFALTVAGCFFLSILVQPNRSHISLMFPLLEVPVSNLGRKPCYPDIFSCLLLWPETKCWHSTLTLNIPSLARQCCLPSWGPRRTPWGVFFCNFSTVNAVDYSNYVFWVSETIIQWFKHC